MGRRQLQFQGRKVLWLPFFKIEVEKSLDRRQLQFQGREVLWLPFVKIEVEKSLDRRQLQFQGREVLWLPFVKNEVKKSLDCRQIYFQEQDGKASWSPHLSRIISRVIYYSLSPVFSFFLSKDKASSMFQGFRFKG